MSDSFSPSSSGIPTNEDRASISTAEPRELSSCERCKSRKLKCDRQRPSCQRCMKVHAPCAYSGRRKPGFPAGQRQFLEEKISRLEAEAKRAKEEALSNRKAIQPSVHVPQPLMIDPASARDQVPPRSNPENFPISTVEKTRAVVETNPPTDLLFSLTALFFRHIHPWLPFLDAQRVFADMGCSGRSIPLLYFALFGVSIPYSCDARLDNRSSDSFWTYSKRRIFVDILEEPSLASLEALTILTLDLSGMTNGAQVWGALSIAVKFCVQLKPVGNRILRISAENRAAKQLSVAEQTHRRRLFWAIYALDSYITITTGHPSDLSDDHIHLFLPTRDATWGLSLVLNSSPGHHRSHNENENVDQAFMATPTLIIFNYQLRLMDISRKVHKVHVQQPSQDGETNAYQRIENLSSCSAELHDWFAGLPRCLLLDDERNRRPSLTSFPASLLMLHAYYHALLIHLHGIAVYPSDDFTHLHMSQQPNDNRQVCMNSVASMLMLTRFLDVQACENVGWPVAWSLWVSCRYLLARNRNEGLNDLESFYLLLDCLKTLSKYWQIGGKYWRLLSQAAAESQTHSLGQNQHISRSNFLAVTDLTIPTSELEDQARPDPVIYTTAATETDIAHIDMNVQFDLETPSYNEPMSGSTFSMAGLMSENWFGASLFPSGSYQD